MARNGVTKYTPERVERILKAISVGSTRTLACHYAGIDTDTLVVWERRYPDFADAVKGAEGKAAVGWLAKIEVAANEGNWQAAAWKLERRYPHDYGRTVQDHRILDMSTFSDEELAAIARGESPRGA